ncbi:hypothetical protein BO94DRAFT_535542 [Aspergillus sclerotioniger CBS 115572]|uniref:Uncharacterized protein n=1 Tax=Aspergillus sclerotioniger CBS 115572 TaxID=1450535 RepID=A0A317WJZ3_9EURO|nr:hypothetical protein BO94DRAFT_535542 [Aspergillus sclerotioniger CBS 115572]PWY86385.1 hypothetical protein BO94DRAFT_535542 [Aspergillus sclerotioniger CBS 115572]
MYVRTQSTPPYLQRTEYKSGSGVLILISHFGLVVLVECPIVGVKLFRDGPTE